MTVVSSFTFSLFVLVAIMYIHFASSHKTLIQPVEFLYKEILHFCIRPVYNSLTDNYVSAVTKIRAERPMNRGSISRRRRNGVRFPGGEEILLYRVLTSSGPIQAPVVISSGVKRPGYEAYHSHTMSKLMLDIIHVSSWRRA